MLSSSGVATGWHGWTMSRGHGAKGKGKDDVWAEGTFCTPFRNKMWCAADNHNYLCHICAKGLLDSNFD